MSAFNPGDQVVFNGSQIATVEVYDEPTGQLVLVQSVGGSENRIYGPIAAYDLQLLVQPAVVEPSEPAELPETQKPVPTFNETQGLNAEDSEGESDGDELTTSESFL